VVIKQELLPSVSIQREIGATKWPFSLKNIRPEGYISLNLVYIYNAKYSVREMYPNYHLSINFYLYRNNCPVLEYNKLIVECKAYEFF
jgi:hypothetical protein